MERRAFVHSTFERNFAVMRLHNTACDRKSQSIPAHAARACLVHAVKSVKDALPMLRLDADTVVSNGEVYLPFLRHERYLDLSMFLRILYRVVHKNEDELAYLLLVCIDLQFLRQNFLDDNVLLLRKGAHDAHCLTGSGYEILS